MTMWLLDGQSIPRITSSPSKGKQMRFTMNLWSATSIGHPTHTEYVDTFQDVGIKTSSSHPKSRYTNPSIPIHSLYMNEWMAPKSNNTTTRWLNNKQESCTRLPDCVASVPVRGKTLPTALGLSAVTFFYCCYIPHAGFLLGHCLAKMPHLLKVVAFHVDSTFFWATRSLSTIYMKMCAFVV